MGYDLSEIAQTANMLADAARQAILPLFRADLETENKLSAGFDPVTAADRAGEAAMREILDKLRPQDGILGEEFGNKTGSSGLTWVLDPIDGTRGFICGTPTWGVLIAVSDVDGPIFGLIDQPFIGERFIGHKGRAEVSGPQGTRPLRTGGTCDLAQAKLLTTFPEIGTKDEARAFRAVCEQVQLTRYGMDCYGYALLAAGQVDLVIEAGLYPYDIQAPIAVVEAAGGVVTDWAGGPAHEGGRALAAANPEIHQQALKLLQAAL